ncbi:dihydrofolate reductase family protein [Mesorhizobium sp. M0761]|uniref:dihydrofolate reductase family protein n=1 Tax=unclassified Mesorhizobium TaxID=325217 RepID=UPI0003CE93F2|nr:MULTISPECIES: dihydrofolate reductase family protein [unclassified Mesorhizobium]ESW84387.1 deaminase reductase [Mesorhizobium sp. LSJC269B00]ESX18129.1 deaminase reductase [Mesorhizobium sp. LSJC255A00]ESX67907.1 deaminase reductase [Mesorhizobium sp. LSHC414A00]ESX94574.1 deaminase reductase [Mesorhizobium sp. LNJC405B00]ESY24931.1 deaminase reductase [Mesorhizobium sp. LNJC394B00]
MSKLRVNAFTLSLDGFGAGPDQDLQNPLGVGGEDLHKWMTGTRTFHEMVGKDGGSTDVDDRFTVRSFDNVGAWILGRNMFGPIRGEWPDENWKGWWGNNPPYHVPTFVLTHHKRDPIVMEGGTIFRFVTGGIHAALEQAKAAAGGKDVRVGGGVSTIRQYLKEKLIDELHLAVSPVLLGRGESLFAGLDMLKLGYQCTEQVATALATHVTIKRV